MTLILVSVGFFLLGGLGALGLGNRSLAAKAAALGILAGSLAGLAGLVFFFQNPGPLPPALGLELGLTLPLGKALFRLDSLSALFLLPVYLVSGLAALTMPSQLRTLSNHVHPGRHGFFFCLLAACVVLVLTAADGIFFFMSWEVMSLAPFFLLCLPNAKAAKRPPSLTYFVAAHLGALPLLLLFAAMTVLAGSSSFPAYAALKDAPLGAFFLLALIGFGTKMGLVPFHGWMPEVYPSAPGHAAAVLSGVIVNAGVYGLIRVLSILGLASGGTGPAWWAYALMITGALSGFYGIMQALAQPDLKRGLAYSSTENMGIISLALGAGLLAAHMSPGRVFSSTTASSLFFAGAMLHLFNHSLFKSLLFLAANAVEQRTGSTAFHLLGGLLKRMPRTAACFAVGAAAIAGLPPLNGFMGELLMYSGFLKGAAIEPASGNTLIFWLGMFALASIAGFSLFTFARMFGLIFLGAPRTDAALEGREPRPLVRLAMLILAGLCLAAGIGAGFMLRPLFPAVFDLSLSLGLTPAAADQPVSLAGLTPWLAAGTCCLLLLLIFGLWLNQRRVRARNGFAAGVTWDCAYRNPTARMQYTGGAFSQMPLRLMAGFLRPEIKTARIGELFPGPSAASVKANDWLDKLWLTALFRPVARLAARAKALQHGLLNVYFLYILLALLLSLVWALGAS